MNTEILEHTPPSKVHTWMLILLSWIAIFSLISVGLLLTKGSSNSLSATDITAACQNGSINAITTNLTRISDACVGTTDVKKPVEQKTRSVIGTAQYPGFSYPIGWSIFGAPQESTGYSISLSSVPILFGVSTVPVHITSIPLPADATPDKQAAFVAALFPAASFSNVSTTSKAFANGTLYTTTDTIIGSISNGAETSLHFFGATNLVTVSYSDALGTDWSVILNSLDWSSVK